MNDRNVLQPTKTQIAEARRLIPDAKYDPIRRKYIAHDGSGHIRMIDARAVQTRERARLVLVAMGFPSDVTVPSFGALTQRIRQAIMLQRERGAV